MFMPNASGRLALVAAALALAGCEFPAAPGPDGLQHPEPPHFSHGQGGPEGADVHQQLAALRRATAPFHNFDRAQEAGYSTQVTVCWFHSGLGAMGYHYADVGLIDGTAELLEPELLVYEPLRSGKLRLVAVEYLVPIAAWAGPSLPSVAGQEFHASGDFYILHIWLWRHNPSGMFADWNPAVTCDHAAESEDLAP